MLMKKKRLFKLNLEQKKAIDGYIFLTPWIIGTLAFFIYPFLHNFWLGVSDITAIIGLQSKYIGFIRYKQLLLEWKWSLDMYINTITGVLTYLPMIIIFSLFVAILLNTNLKGKGLFRMICVLPFLLGSGYVIDQLLGTSAGGVESGIARGINIPDEVLQYLGPMVNNVVSSFLEKITLVMWRSGVQIIIFLGALQSIPASHYEAAKCDGATAWESFWKITFPMTIPYMLLNAIYTMTDLFIASDNPVMQWTISNEGIFTGDYELVSAVNSIYIVMILLLVGFNFLISLYFEKKYN